MDAILYLLPAALFLGLLGLGAFMWCLRTGQFDDLDGAAHRVLSDDDLLQERSQPPSRPKDTGGRPDH